MRRLFFPPVVALVMLACVLAALSGCGPRQSDEDTADSVKITQLTDLPKISVTRGEQLYRYHCLFCHGEEGRGDGLNAYNLKISPRNFTDSRRVDARTDEQLAQTIANGGQSSGLSNEMPPWGNTLTQEQIAELVSHIRRLGRGPEGGGVEGGVKEES